MKKKEDTMTRSLNRWQRHSRFQPPPSKSGEATMSRNITVFLAALSVVATLAGGCNTIAADEVKRPNILWIIAEDLSQDLGCYGEPTVNTPHIDRLATQGVRYTHVFGTSSVCAVKLKESINCCSLPIICVSPIDSPLLPSFKPT